MLALEGELWPGEEDLLFDSARFSLRDQSLWAQWESWSDVDRDKPAAPPRLQHNALPDVPLPCAGANLRVVDAANWSGPGPQGRWTLESACRFDLEAEVLISLDDLDYEWLRPLQLLITSATGRQSGLDDLYVANSNWSGELGDTVHSIWLRVRHSSRTVARPALDAMALRHRLQDLNFEERFDDVLGALRHHRYALERYEEVRLDGPRRRESRLLSAVQAVEALDAGLNQDRRHDWQDKAVELLVASGLSEDLGRKPFGYIRRYVERAHRPALAGRLLRVDEQTGGVISDLVPNRSWADDVATVRNAVTHGATGDQLRAAAGAITVASEIALMLFDVRWLMVLGREPDQARDLVRQRLYGWADEQLVRENAPVLKDVASELRRRREQ